MHTEISTDISLNVSCVAQSCADFAGPLWMQLSHGRYDRCSVLDLAIGQDEWRDQHPTARKRADKCAKKGYQFSQIDRAQYEDDIYAINTSLDRRQGRPMTSAYQQRPTFSQINDACNIHTVRPYGVLNGKKLVAYLWLYRAGELALVSSILGHGAHLDNHVMYLLMEGVIAAEEPYGGYLVYNRHDSGTEGLRWFKERCGFEEREVDWHP